MTATADFHTVPSAAFAVKCPLDRLRKTLRRDPVVRRLFEWIGPVRVIPSSRLPDLKRAMAVGQ